MSSAEQKQIGRTHYLTRNQRISEEENKEIDFAKIGRKLMNSGKGRFTEYGMLFSNNDIPAKTIYNGIPAPENSYGDKIVEVSVVKEEKKVSLWLPETKNTLNRVLTCLNSILDTNLKKSMQTIYDEESGLRKQPTKQQSMWRTGGTGEELCI